MIGSFEAQKVISQHCKNQIVVTTFTTNREWPQVSCSPELDLPIGTMGKASSVGLGLALAQPDKKVIVLDGDGGLLMNLGSLVTIAAMAPRNLIHFVFENGVYRTTGGQPVPNTGKTSLVGMAKAAGYANVHQFEDLASLEKNIVNIFKQAGPTFVCLKVPPDTERPPFPPVRMQDKLSGFVAALQHK